MNWRAIEYRLQAIDDALLPKLLSGELRVSGANRAIEEEL